MKTIEQKALAYDEALEKAKKLYEKGTITESIGYIFPEIEKSEDERIRTAIFNHLKKMWGNCKDDICGVHVEDAIAWLEKQESVEEIVARCKNSWYNEGKIDGKFEGIADYVKYQQGWHDALEKQGEQNLQDDVRRRSTIQVLEYARSIPDYNQFGKDDIDKNIAWLEKQGEKPQGKTAFEAIKEKPADNANKVASAWNNGYSNGYIQAIDKACEWLKNHNDYIDVKDGNITYFDMKKCVEDFKKAMED